MRRMIRQAVVATTAGLLLLGGGAAFADTQPANLGNVGASDRGASASDTAKAVAKGAPAPENTGPHCHFVLPADGNGPFDMIVTGAAHTAHVQTGLPTGVFQATGCP